MADASAVPSNIRSRLIKLQALASDDRGNEHEAAAASAKLQAMLAEYNLEMAQLDGGDDPLPPDAQREHFSCILEAETEWQSRLLSAITSNNFCLGFRHHNHKRTYNLIGRTVNIRTTVNVYSYLTGAVERLCPFKDKRTKSHRSWKEGCAERLIDRLNQQRWDSEAASRQKREPGNGSELVLADVYSTEDDLNRDFRWGYPVGTSARERMESQARWEAECEARRNAPKPVETEDERKGRLAKEAKENARWQREWERRRKAEDAKRDPLAYAMGQTAGSEISLNQQIAEPEAAERVGWSAEAA